jgi:hypothetical protein
MRAKFLITEVAQSEDAEGNVNSERLEMMAVVSGTDADGYSEDNTFARYTPTARLSMTVLNPALFGQYKSGDKYYADFSKAEE